MARRELHPHPRDVLPRDGRCSERVPSVVLCAKRLMDQSDGCSSMPLPFGYSPVGWWPTSLHRWVTGRSQGLTARSDSKAAVGEAGLEPANFRLRPLVYTDTSAGTSPPKPTLGSRGFLRWCGTSAHQHDSMLPERRGPRCRGPRLDQVTRTGSPGWRRPSCARSRGPCSRPRGPP